MKLKVIELFGGITACSQALKKLGIEVELADYVEIDKYAVASANAINGTNFEPQDISKWDKDIKDVDLIMHGSPCQDFSLAGLQQGGDKGSGTRSSLMYESIRIINKLKPKYVCWENVKNLLSKKHIHNFENYINAMSIIGYESFYKVLNSKNYGIPQNRERVFCVSIRKDLDQSFEFPEAFPLKLHLKDMLEDEDKVDEKYYLSEKMIKYVSATGGVTTTTKIQESISTSQDLSQPSKTKEQEQQTTSVRSCPDNFNLADTERESKIMVGDYRYDEGIRIRKDGLCPTLPSSHLGTASLSGQPFLFIKESEDE